MSARPACLTLLLTALTASLGGCAWTHRENRPVWNSFEQHLVPADTGWFVATLPVTVPIGFLAIVTDTFVAHPIQVIDDAADDAGWLWRNGRPDFAGRYYSEMAFLPARCVLTPLFFTASFLGRSAFHIDEPDEAELAARRAKAEAQARDRLLAWLAEIATGRFERHGHALPAQPDARLAAAAEGALRAANALGRLRLFELAMGADPGLGLPDPLTGLEDPDPVVRYGVLLALPDRIAVPAGLVEALRQDPVDSVRTLARGRWHEERP